MAMVPVVCPCCGKNLGNVSSTGNTQKRCTNPNCKVMVIVQRGQVCGWK